MADYPAYASIDQFKRDIKVSATDTADDATWTAQLVRASRIIDRLCRRAPGAFMSTTETRYFDVPPFDAEAWIIGAAGLDVDPLLTITTLKTDEDGDRTYETTWSASTDYYTWPYNEPPIRRILVDAINGSYAGFPAGRRRVEIAGAWGEYASPPEPIVAATILMANRLRNRANSPEGVAGDADRGFVRLAEMDPDVGTILRNGGYIVDGIFA